MVALSGGPDSTALLHALIGLGYSVEAAHLNHQFRGVEADDDAKYVASLCKSFSVKLTTTSLDVPQIQAERKISAQQAAREVRYKFLEEVRAGHRLDWIVTAHNFDDRVETVLLNIIRGTGIDGFTGHPIPTRCDCPPAFGHTAQRSRGLLRCQPPSPANRTRRTRYPNTLETMFEVNCSPISNVVTPNRSDRAYTVSPPLPQKKAIS